MNDVQYNITSLLLVFNKSVVFRQQMLFFHLNLNFYLNECTESWKINICCRKTTFLLKMSNNDVVLLPASNIASCAHADNSNQHPSTILRFSKNLDFWQILKIDFEHHICCHVYDLSNITNWQHIGGGLNGNKLTTNLWLPIAPQFNFHLWCRFFSGFDKINSFWQQN